MRKQRVTESAADQHDLHAEPLESTNGLERTRRERVDVGA